MRYYFVLLIFLMAACKKDQQPVVVVTHTPKIESLGKDRVQEGDTLYLTGKDLQAEGLQPQVFVNGRPAAIIAANAETVKFIVPSKVTTGAVVLTLGNATAEGPILTVIPTALVSSYSPKFVVQGDELTLTGTNFAPVASDNEVFIGGKLATVKSVSTTKLIVDVPTDATGGDISWRVYKGPVRSYTGTPLLVRLAHYDATSPLDWMRQDPGFSFIYKYITVNEPGLSGDPSRDTLMTYLNGERPGTLFIPNNNFAYSRGQNTEEDVLRFFMWYDVFWAILSVSHDYPVTESEWAIGQAYPSVLDGAMHYWIEGRRNYFSITQQDGQLYVNTLYGTTPDGVKRADKILRSFTVGSTVVYEIETLPFFESQP